MTYDVYYLFPNYVGNGEGPGVIFAGDFLCGLTSIDDVLNIILIHLRNNKRD